MGHLRIGFGDFFFFKTLYRREQFVFRQKASFRSKFHDSVLISAFIIVLNFGVRVNREPQKIHILCYIESIGRGL